MNTLRMGLVMMALAVGSVYAIDRIKFDETGLKMGKGVWDAKFTLATTLYADNYFKKDDYAKKAAVSTFGFALDTLGTPYNKSKKAKFAINTHYAENVVTHLGTNWVIQRGAALVHDQGITLEAAGNICKTVVNKCDYLPENGLIRDFANFTAENVVKPGATLTAEFATHPETLTLLALHYVMIPMLQTVEK